MAKTTVVTITDDLDGTKAATTVQFGWKGATYEIDLSKKNAAALDKALAPYVDAARKVRGGPSARRTRRTRAAATARGGQSAIRAWAKQNGYDIADRGRIPAEVVSAFSARG